MEKIAFDDIAAIEKFISEDYGSFGNPLEVSQQMINDFAELTGDRQWIHLDVERCKTDSPFGTTIAHGFLTLSMLTHLAGSVPQDPETVKGVIMGVNYGFDKVRFVSPVPSGAKIRATSSLKDVQLKDPNNIQVTRTYTVEVEGAERPAVVADWITRLTYA